MGKGGVWQVGEGILREIGKLRGGGVPFCCVYLDPGVGYTVEYLME